MEHIYLTLYICTTNLRTITKMTAEKRQKKRIITVISYYRLLKHKQKGQLKKEIMQTCGWSESTFHYKIEKNNIEKLELEAIEKIISEYTKGIRKWN